MNPSTTGYNSSILNLRLSPVMCNSSITTILQQLLLLLLFLSKIDFLEIIRRLFQKALNIFLRSPFNLLKHLFKSVGEIFPLKIKRLTNFIWIVSDFLESILILWRDC